MTHKHNWKAITGGHVVASHGKAGIKKKFIVIEVCEELKTYREVEYKPNNL